MKLIVFLVCSGTGYLLGTYLPAPYASYVSILVSYHLFLAWLVITADHETGLSMPILSAVLTHAACLALLIGLAMGSRHVPFLSLVRIFVPGLAPFECDWLFSGGKKKIAAPVEAVDAGMTHSAPAAAATTETLAAAEPASEAAAISEVEYTADEHSEWIRYLSQARRAFRKPGLSVGDEFKMWQAARAKERILLAQKPQQD